MTYNSMTIKQVIALLQELGHNVEFRKRNDGGYLITNIDGKKYSGAKGNAVAREITGQTLSQKRQAQLEKIKPPKIDPLDKQVKNLIKKVQKYWRQNQVKAKGKITTKKTREYFQEYGRQNTIEALNKQLRYAQGIAYEENIIYLEGQLKKYNDVKQSQKLAKVIEWIKTHHDTFKEEWIHPSYEILYDGKKEKSADQVAIDLAKMYDCDIGD